VASWDFRSAGRGSNHAPCEDLLPCGFLDETGVLGASERLLHLSHYLIHQIRARPIKKLNISRPESINSFKYSQQLTEGLPKACCVLASPKGKGDLLWGSAGKNL